MRLYDTTHSVPYKTPFPAFRFRNSERIMDDDDAEFFVRIPGTT